jgi:hypothetical protein
VLKVKKKGKNAGYFEKFKNIFKKGGKGERKKVKEKFPCT